MTDERWHGELFLKLDFSSLFFPVRRGSPTKDIIRTRNIGKHLIFISNGKETRATTILELQGASNYSISLHLNVR